MSHLTPKNLISLVIAAICAIPLGAVLPKYGANPVIALLTVAVTVLLLQVAFLRRDLSNLKEQTEAAQKS